jgi:hypothetical protein
MKHRDALEIIRTLAFDPLVNEISRDEQAGELLFALAIDWEPDDPYLIGPIFTLSFDAQENALGLFNHEDGRTLWLGDDKWDLFHLYIYLGIEKRNLRYITLEDYVKAEVEYA